MPQRVLLLLILFIATPGLGQVNNPAYADYLLVGRFGEICTMCEAIVLCQASDSALQHERIPSDGSFTIYHLQTRTFWSQVGTIWEWFIANFDADSLARGGHTRPVIIYDINAGAWSSPRTVDAHLSLEPAIVALDKHIIDRIERKWRGDSSPDVVGYCRRLPLWESLDVIAQHNE